MHFCAISCSTLYCKIKTAQEDLVCLKASSSLLSRLAPLSTMALMPLLLLLAIHHCAAFTQGFPCGACHVEDLMCSMHENTLSTLPGVASIEDCRGACNDQPECAFLTYFAADSFPFSETCFLFSACDEVLDCMACTTEVNSCPEEEEGLCSGPVEGILGDNIVEFLPDVESEAACLDACSANSNCSFYTHHSECDLSYPGACILLSHLEGSLLPCEHCRTGAKACSDACYFIGEGGEPVPSMVLTNTSTTTTINTVALGICQMNILVVGGGGAGNNGGGGSGELTWARWNVSGSSIVIARVGQHGQPTRVELQVPPSMASLVIAQVSCCPFVVCCPQRVTICKDKSMIILAIAVLKAVLRQQFAKITGWSWRRWCRRFWRLWLLW